MSNSRFKIMGILNATPDSFSGDGEPDWKELSRRGLEMLQSGADILDIGGESSAPYSSPVSYKDEINRVVPVIKELRSHTDAVLSIDTYHPETAAAAINAGANIINDISGFRDPEMLHLAAEKNVSIVIMHMQGSPQNMQDKPCYEDVTTEVREFLSVQYHKAINAGIDRNKIIVDPGIGFGKSLDHNLTLISQIDQLRIDDCKILLGASRKSMIGQILNLSVDQRLEGSLAVVAAGALKGNDIFRVHDVTETRRFLTVFEIFLDKGLI